MVFIDFSTGFEGTPDPTVHLQIMYKQKHVYKEYHNPENIHIRDVRIKFYK